MRKIICSTVSLFLLCATFMSAQAQFQTSDKVVAPRFYKHKVRVNENMQTISTYYAVSTNDLSMLNNIAPDHKLKPDDIVLIRELKDGEPENVIADDAKDAPAVSAKKEKSTPEPTMTTTAVSERKTSAPKATASTPAATTEVPAEMLKGPDGTTYQKSTTAYHIVEKGQTFYRITKIYGLSAEQLMSMNNLSTTVLEVGQKLKVAK